MFKSFLMISSVVLIIFLLGSFYYMQIQQDASFVTASFNNSFPSYTTTQLQFYPNMRFPSSNISYRIVDCSLEKSSNMIDAFNFIADQTVLEFYSVDDGQEITVTCGSEIKESEQGFFIAGEGGPTNITSTDRYNVISSGKVLLLRESRCPQSNIGIHELLHVLGFDHSTESRSIMYPISSCSQVVTEDIFQAIDAVYQDPSYADLAFRNVSAELNDGYLNVRFTVTNQGLVSSSSTVIDISSGDWKIDSVELDPLVVGYGRIVKLTNVRLFPHSIENITFTIQNTSAEIETANNEVTLSVIR